MTKTCKVCWIAVLLALTEGSALASIIKTEAGYTGIGSQVNVVDYKTAVEAAILSSANHGTVIRAANNGAVDRELAGGAIRNIAVKTTIDFHVSPVNAGVWAFRTDADFGYGGAVFLDNTAYVAGMQRVENNDDAARYFNIVTHLVPGNHVLTVYRIGTCCDSAQQVQFKIGNGVFTAFNINDGISPVPEPDTYAMVLVGLFLFIVSLSGSSGLHTGKRRAFH